VVQALYGRLMRGLSRRAGLRVFRFFSRPLDSTLRAAPLPVRSMREDELLALCGDPELDLRAEGVRAAFARGDVCVAVPDRETVAAYCWFAFAPLHHLDGVWVRFGPQAAWTYKSLVRSSHRGRGIASALYRFGDAACRERGRATSLICVEEHNTPSISAALRAGYSPGGRAAYVRRGTALHAWYSRALADNAVRFYCP
jgi:GNAT superfamily N-acetyltransferase